MSSTGIGGPIESIRFQSRGPDCADCGAHDLPDRYAVGQRVEFADGSFGGRTVCTGCALADAEPGIERCPECGGSGISERDPSGGYALECPACEGFGAIKSATPDAGGEG